MKDFVRKAGAFALIAVFVVSCNNKNNLQDGKEKVLKNDSGVTLLLKDAAMVQNDSNPQYNTAEWSFIVNDPGRYDVWLSSLTSDTTFTLYAHKVTITSGDTRLEKRPVGDEIVTDDKNVKAPWYRADSHMGSIFFSEAGEYHLQIISDRVTSSTPDNAGLEEHTFITSLILKPKLN